MKNISKSAILILSLIFISGALHAQTVDKILKQHLKVTGAKKYKKVETIQMNASLPTMQGEFPFTIYSKRPNKLKIQLDIPGMGLMVPSAYDGETAWMINPMMGATTAQKYPDDGALLIADQAQFDPLYINYGDKGYTITLEGTEEVNGKNAYKLKIDKSLGDGSVSNTQYHYFDTETYMLLKVNSKGADGTVSDTFFSEYKKTDFGVMMPYLWEISGPMGMQELIIEEIIGNQPIDDEVFAFPGG